MISTDFSNLKSVDQATAELRERNEARVAEIKKQMGRKFVLHPDNAPKKTRHKKVLKAV
jgi:hypothetical protein